MTDDVTHKEILKIKKEIIANETKAKVFLEVDGLKSRKEIENQVPFSQPTGWRAIKYLERKGLICDLGETKEGSSIYGKPRWVKVLYIDEYVRDSILDER